MLIGGHDVSTTTMAGKKRKKNINSDEETVATKISRKSKNKKTQSVEDVAKVTTVPKRKYFEIRNKQTLNPVKYNGEKIKNSKECGAKSDVHKHTIKQKSKSPTCTNTNMTQRLEKQLEARRKRRAKRKVVIK